MLIYSAAAIFMYMCLWFIAAAVTKDNSIVDPAWGGGFVVVAVLTLFAGGWYTPRQVLLTSLVAIWGLRLAVFLYIRHSKVGEDYRYQEMRQGWKRPMLRSFLQVFMLQGVIMFVVALPVIFTNAGIGDPLSLLNYIGLALWLFGMFWEVVGDQQKYNFKNRPENKGKTIMSGLWKYTRHPNYFGEMMLWWGIYLVSVGGPYQFWGWIGPLVITFFLVKVSGVAMLERKYEGDTEYEAYKQRTSALIPWSPKQT